jgi:hypothetical protein
LRQGLRLLQRLRLLQCLRLSLSGSLHLRCCKSLRLRLSLCRRGRLSLLRLLGLRCGLHLLGLGLHCSSHGLWRRARRKGKGRVFVGRVDCRRSRRVLRVRLLGCRRRRRR